MEPTSQNRFRISQPSFTSHKQLLYFHRWVVKRDTVLTVFINPLAYFAGTVHLACPLHYLVVPSFCICYQSSLPPFNIRLPTKVQHSICRRIAAFWPPGGANCWLVGGDVLCCIDWCNFFGKLSFCQGTNALYDICNKAVAKFSQQTAIDINNTATGEIVNEGTFKCNGGLAVTTNAQTYFNGIVQQSAEKEADTG